MNSDNVYSTIGNMTSLYEVLASVTGYKKSVKYFISQLPFPDDAPLQILDAGCGTGLYAMELLKKYPHAHITAIDSGEKLMEYFQKKVTEKKLDEKVRLLVADIQSSLPELQHEQFDLVITAGVLEYVNQEAAIQNLSRFLVPGGYFYSLPVRDNALGRFICTIYACKPYTSHQNIVGFTRNGFTLHAEIDVPKTPSASFREAHLFKKS